MPASPGPNTLKYRRPTIHGSGSPAASRPFRFLLARLASPILALEGDRHGEWVEGNFADNEEDKKRRLGPDAIVPRRGKSKRLPR